MQRIYNYQIVYILFRIEHTCKLLNLLAFTIHQDYLPSNVYKTGTGTFSCFSCEAIPCWPVELMISRLTSNTSSSKKENGKVSGDEDDPVFRFASLTPRRGDQFCERKMTENYTKYTSSKRSVKKLESFSVRRHY